MKALGLPSFYRKDWAKVHDRQMASICDRKNQLRLATALEGRRSSPKGMLTET